jgi:hypothetical protein
MLGNGPHASQEDRFVDMNAFDFAGWCVTQTGHARWESFWHLF